MLFAAHAITGGLAGSGVGNPILAFLVGFLLHFVLDFIPHFDTTDKGKLTFRQVALVALDLVVGFLIIGFYIKPTNISFWYGLFGCILPDLLDVVPFWNKPFRKWWIGSKMHTIHEKVHTYRLSFIPGILTQIALVIIALFIYSIR